MITIMGLKINFAFMVTMLAILAASIYAAGEKK